MSVLTRVLDWVVSVTVERHRQPGQSCKTCRHFDDLTDPDDGDYLGKCAYLIDTLGWQKAFEINEYGGNWTHVDSWCSQWAEGPSLWQPVQQTKAESPADPL